jgi:hypothetical protein
LLLPSAVETDLLRACLGSGQVAGEGWRRFCGGETTPVPAAVARCPAVRRLVPLLYANLGANHVHLDPQHQSWLRAGTVRERFRSAVYRRAFREIMEIPATGGLPVLVTRGAALAETVYPARELRHCHDLDLLVAPDSLPRAGELLAAAGMRPAPAFAEPGSDRFLHESGMPVVLHTRLFPSTFYAAPVGDLLRRGRDVELARVPSKILPAEDMLVHVCGHAACSSSRDSLQWACDARTLIDRTPDLDWQAVSDRAHQARIGLPLATMFEYLAGELNAPIPNHVLSAFVRAAETAGPDECEAAFTCLQRGRRGSLRSCLAAAKDLRTKAWIMRWKLLPSQPGLVPDGDLSRAGWLPKHRVAHLARLARGRFRCFMRRFDIGRSAGG